MRTAQEIFDTVVNHLRKQGAPAYDINLHSCRYLTPDGLTCAVGCLIDRSQYMPEYEDHNISKLLALHLLPDDLQQEFAAHEALLARLQRVHDSKTFWESGFADIAYYYQLQYTPPETK